MIRKIELKDNPALSVLIRSVLGEFAAPAEGTALQDPSLDHMYETYERERGVYFVVETDGRICGGCGVLPLEGGPGNVCELQKMYLLKDCRGRGYGKQLLEACLSFARENGFSACYLETLPGMDAARIMYDKAGFRQVNTRMGNTGHFSCDIWLLKEW